MAQVNKTTAAVLAGVAMLSLAVVAGAQALRKPDSAARLLPPRVTAGGEPFVDNLHAVDTKRWTVSDGWYNGKYMVNDWRAKQARFDGSGLLMTLAANKTDLADYSSAEVQSKRNFGNGYFEARMQAAPGSGVNTGFFTYTGPPFGKPWDEIDVEIIGRKPREVMFTYFRNGDKVSKIVPVDYDATKELHTYGFDWQPGYIRWYIDGKLAHEATGDDLPLPITPQKIMAGVWGSDTLTSWLGKFDKASLPTSGRISCIAYSESFETRRSCE